MNGIPFPCYIGISRIWPLLFAAIELTSDEGVLAARAHRNIVVTVRPMRAVSYRWKISYVHSTAAGMCGSGIIMITILWLVIFEDFVSNPSHYTQWRLFPNNDGVISPGGPCRVFLPRSLTPSPVNSHCWYVRFMCLSVKFSLLSCREQIANESQN